MCIRHHFNVAVAQALADETFIAPGELDDAIALAASLPDATFAHPLALARMFAKRGFVDDEVFGAVASAIGPAVRGYVRLRKHHGDLFAGTPAALPLLGKPILANGYRRLARRTKGQSWRKLSKADPNRGMPSGLRPRPNNGRGADSLKAERIAAQLHTITEVVAAARARTDPTPRAFPSNVVDLVALRAQRAPA